MESFINKRLQHLPPKERKSALVMLSIIGLESVCQSFGANECEVLIDSDTLYRCCDEIFREKSVRLRQPARKEPVRGGTSIGGGEKQQSKKKKSGIAGRKAWSVKDLKLFHTAPAPGPAPAPAPAPAPGAAAAKDAQVGSRRSRPDSMHSYPFVDDRGSVQEALKVGPKDAAAGAGGDSDENGCHLRNTSLPGRMRLITKAYHETTRSGGKAGMRFEDIPVALRSLGVPVSKRLARVLESGRGVGLGVGDATAAGAAAGAAPLPSTITLVQFQALVKKVLKMQQQESDALAQGQGGTLNAVDDDEEAGDDSEEGGSGARAAVDSLVDAILRTEEEGGDVGTGQGQGQRRKGTLKVQHTRASLQRRQINGGAAGGGSRPSARAESSADRIRRDRQTFAATQKAEDRAVKAVVGQHKVSQYLDNQRPPWAPRDHKVTPEEDAQGRTKLWSYKSPRPLSNNSGDVVVSIADAFLAGPIARDILGSQNARTKVFADKGRDSPRGKTDGVHIAGYYGGSAAEDDAAEANSSLEGSNEDVEGLRELLDREGRGEDEDGDGEKGPAFDRRRYHVDAGVLREGTRLDGGGSGGGAGRELGAYGGYADEEDDDAALHAILHGAVNNTRTGGGGGVGFGVGRGAGGEGGRATLNQGTGTARSGSKWQQSRGGWVADFGPLHTHSLTPYAAPTKPPAPAAEGTHARSSSAPHNSRDANGSDRDHADVGGDSDGNEDEEELENYVVERPKHRANSTSKGGKATKGGIKHRSAAEAAAAALAAEPPVRSYDDIARTYRETGVKPWVQHRMLQKYYGRKSSEAQAVTNKTHGQGQGQGREEEGSSLFADSAASSRIGRGASSAPAARGGAGADSSNAGSSSADSDLDFSDFDLNRAIKGMGRGGKGANRGASGSVDSSSADTDAERRHGGDGSGSGSVGSYDSAISSVPSEFDVRDVKLPAHLQGEEEEQEEGAAAGTGGRGGSEEGVSDGSAGTDELIDSIAVARDEDDSDA